GKPSNRLEIQRPGTTAVPGGGVRPPRARATRRRACPASLGRPGRPEKVPPPLLGESLLREADTAGDRCAGARSRLSADRGFRPRPGRRRSRRAGVGGCEEGPTPETRTSPPAEPHGDSLPQAAEPTGRRWRGRQLLLRWLGVRVEELLQLGVRHDLDHGLL